MTRCVSARGGAAVVCIPFVLCLLAVGVQSGLAGETLYNGIVLPDAWPPYPSGVPYPQPVPPPYLQSPPAVIPMDVGRQLFVDDFLIDQTTLTRTHHQPQYYAGNPVLWPENYWERNTAMAFSDGVWWDPNDRTFKMWYMAGGVYTCLATSRDALSWTKPVLGVYPARPQTNIVVMPAEQRDSGMIWLDLEATDPAQRFRITYFRVSLHNCLSPDGIHWNLTLPGDDGWVGDGHPTGDRSTFFYNPFRKVWVYSVRRNVQINGTTSVRGRRYAERTDWTEKLPPSGELSLWYCADQQDLPYPPYDVPTQLYNLDATPYESLQVGLFSIWHGDCRDVNTPQGLADAAAGRPKLNCVKVGYTRDGFYWDRPDRRAWLPWSEQASDWNWGNVQSVGGGFLVMGDRLYIFCSGRRAQPAVAGKPDTTGLAFLRRDGFASMDADPNGGTLTTRPVTFQGRYLFVNVDNPQGELRVEVLDANGEVIAPFSAANCVALAADATLHRIRWAGAADLAGVAGQTVRFRFHLTNGSLYAFWVSPDESGASYGYVAAGGPGYSSNRDTEGLEAYAAAYVLGQVDAGADQTVMLPGNTGALDGTVTDAGLPAGASWTSTWSVTSGPAPVVLGDAGAVDTTATFSQAGIYVLRLVISDTALTAYDELTVTVAGNSAPAVDAGEDKVATLDAPVVTLDGTVSDDGLPLTGSLTSLWVQVTGPGTVTFADNSDPDTTATFPSAGTYVLRLYGFDGETSASDEMTVIVEAANAAPQVAAGADQVIAWPQTVASLDGTVSDDGLPSYGSLTTTWSEQSGPGAVTFANASAVDTSVTFTQRGQYVLRLTASDGALSASDEVTLVAGLRGDLDGDGLITADDVDLLYAVLDTTVPPTEAMYDLTEDGQVTFADARELVEVIVGTSMADTNLDMKVNLQDLGNLANRYGSAGTFSDCDTNGDGMVGLQDLGNLANDYGKTYP